ncbi:hypothetical protein Tco_0976484 [Tanacetum coccineum]|uniref:Uncharacterized protein n=1 Tax=Tanacetum coccineum TaxID=301880 RepID=A0ABQ5EHN1_9ASTR
MLGSIPTSLSDAVNNWAMLSHLIDQQKESTELTQEILKVQAYEVVKHFQPRRGCLNLQFRWKIVKVRIVPDQLETGRDLPGHKDNPLVHIEMEMVSSCSGKDKFITACSYFTNTFKEIMKAQAYVSKLPYEHVGLQDTRSQDDVSPQVDDQRLKLVDDLKEAQDHISSTITSHKTKTTTSMYKISHDQMTQAQDGERPQVDDQRLDLADDLKEAQDHISHSITSYKTKITTSKYKILHEESKTTS